MTLPEDYKFYDDDLNANGARVGLMVAPLCIADLANKIYEEVLEPYDTHTRN